MSWTELRGPSRWALESVVVIALFVCAAVWGGRYEQASRAAGRPAAFYQEYFEPAVMLACGHGFSTIAGPKPPALTAFLEQQADRFACSELPNPLRLTKDGQYQYAWYYLMLAVGAAWRVLGVTWSGLAPLFGVLFGVSVTLGYAMFRFAAPMLLALMGAMALALSRLQLEHLPPLRDYAKAPFVLALIALLLVLVRRPLSSRMLMAVSVAYGAVLGIGYGFRTDLLANIPPFFLTVAAFMPDGPLARVRVRALMAGTMVATFLLVSWPATHYVVTKGGCQWHVALLGWANRFSPELGVSPSPVEVNATWNDMYLYTAVMSAANRERHADVPVTFCSPEYDRVSGAMLTSVVTRFPADVMTRALGSTWKVVDLPFYWYGSPLNGYAPTVYRWRATVLKAVGSAGRWAPIVSVLGLGAVSVRLGLCALLFAVYFGGYPALQFETRHFFHLEFIGLWSLLFVVSHGLRAARWTWARRLGDVTRWLRQAPQAIVFAALAVAIVWLPLTLLRWYQGRQTVAMIQALLDEPREPVAFAPTPDGHHVLLAADRVPGTDPRVEPMETAYLDVHIDPAACPDSVPLAVSYGRAPAGYDFSGPLELSPMLSKAHRVLVPVYRGFTGFDLGTADAACIQRIDRLTNARTEPLLLQVNVPDDWRSRPMYQQLELW